MINLLPLSEKKKLLREHQLRLGIVVLSFLFALELFGFFVFIPAYYALYLNGNDLARTLSEKQALTPKEAREAPQMLAMIKKEIAVLYPSTNITDTPPSLLLREILASKPEGIWFNAFAYTRASDAVSMNFSGIARTQDDLLAFRRDVKANPRVLDFKYASSFIIKKSDIDFSATITFR